MYFAVHLSHNRLPSSQPDSIIICVYANNKNSLENKVASEERPRQIYTLQHSYFIMQTNQEVVSQSHNILG